MSSAREGAAKQHQGRTPATTAVWRGDLRLLPSAVTAWTAAACAIRGTGTGATTGGVLASAGALVLATLVLLLRHRSRQRWVPLSAQVLAPVATLALVLLATGGSLVRAESGPVGKAVDSGSTFTAILRISGEPTSLGPGKFGGERFLMEADIVGGFLHGSEFVAQTPVAVLGDDAWSGIGMGDTVEVMGSAKPSDRIGRATALFLPATAPTVEEAQGWLAYTKSLRVGFRDLARGDARDGGLLPGMALGDRTGLDTGLEEAMRTTGLTHLTAVSGANCSYVIAFAFLGLRMARLSRLPAAAGAVLALVGFVLLVRPEPSVLRAAVMGAVGVAAVLSGRGKVSLTLLLLSIIVLLAVDPWLSVSFAFMLSVAATLGLVTVGPLVVESLEGLLPRFAAQLLAIPLTAQLFCAPILVVLQPSLPVYSLPANVLAAPVVPAITLLGMLAVLALIVAPVLAQPLIGAAQWGTRWVAGIADTLAAAPAASLPWLSGPPGVIACLTASVLVLTLILRRERLMAKVTGRRTAGLRQDPAAVGSARAAGRPAARVPRRGSRRHFVLGLALVLGVVAGGAITLRPSGPPDWAIAVCDVGQGDGLVIRTEPGHALVVDAGPDPGAMDRCLDHLAVDVLDAVIITHLHDDHYGGIEGVVRGRTVRALYYSTGEAALPADLVDAAAGAGIEPQRLTTDMPLDLAPLEVEVLWPPAGMTTTEENNASVVLGIEVPTGGRDVSILLTGDLEEDAALTMLRAQPFLSSGGVDILKVAHHGARNGGTDVIEAVQPSLAVISLGRDNDYGHPHATIIEALDRAGIATARTDELGSFTVSITAETLEVRELP
jgi:ComEC/Rec2-related protein